MKPKITIEVYDGDDVVRTQEFVQEVIKIGSGTSSHVALEGDTVARMHSLIEANPDGTIAIIDLGSSAGTILNGNPIKQANLQDSDELNLGGHRLVVRIEADDEVKTSPGTVVSVPTTSEGSTTSPTPVPGPAAVSTATHAEAPKRSHAPEPTAPAVAAAAISAPPPIASMRPSSGGVFAGPPPSFSATPSSRRPADTAEVDSAEDAMEIVIMWGSESILHVEHLNPPRPFYVGDEVDAKGNPATDFLIDADTIGASRIPVVVESGSGFAVVIPEGATGNMEMEDRVIPLEAFRASGEATPCGELPGALQLALGKDSTARVEHNGFTFLVKPVAAGKRIPVPVIMDTRPLQYVAGSLAFFSLILLLFYFLPPRGSALNLDLLNADSRLVEYMMQPPELEEEENPDWLKGDDKEGGTGERHKLEEGAMGREEAEKTTNMYGIKGPKDNPDPHMAREEAKEAARSAGILGVLSQMTGSFNAPTSPFGRDTALGQDPMSAMGALMGNQIGENAGFGGLGLRGTGRGGGGTGEGTIGLGRLGTMGHGAGGGSGSGYGRGAGGLGGRSARVPQIRSGAASVRGSLSKEVIRRIVQRHRNEVKFCYEQELNARPDLEGRVTIRFIISPSGAVQSSEVSSSDIGNRRVEQCIAQAVRRWPFPSPDGGGVVVVNYPFLLSAPGG